MTQRYYSLDIFRGCTVAFMILVNNQMGPAYTPLDHAPWHGLTPTDLVFPFFLFAVGNAMAFVMPRLRESGPRTAAWKISKRALLIFVIGLLLSWSPFCMWLHNVIVWKPWTWVNDAGVLSGVRILGVLGRIALCYFFAGMLVYFCRTWTVVFISIGMLIAYWLLCLSLGAPGDPYSLSGYFGTAWDRQILHEAHMYHGEGVAFDPEGIASTIPAIVSVVSGYFTGVYIRQKGKTYEMLRGLLVTGALLLCAGYAWGQVFPINKKIWTSSYVLVSSGYAILTLAFFIYCIEFRAIKRIWCRFLEVFGKNPLFIFVLSGFIPRLTNLIRIPGTPGPNGQAVFLSPFRWTYLHIFQPLTGGDARSASLLFALALLGFYWLIGYWLDRKRIYIRV